MVYVAQYLNMLDLLRKISLLWESIEESFKRLE